MPDNYWRDRELEHIQKSIMNDAALSRRLQQKHIAALDEIQKEIDAFYGRYASREGITMAEARKRVSRHDVDKYRAKAKRYVAEKNFSKLANREMRIYNVTMSISRLELLKRNVELELIAMFSDQERILFEALTDRAKAEYLRQSGILERSINFSEKNLRTIANSSFLSAVWSERLWDDMDALRHELDRLLNRGISQGKNPRFLARELRKKFDTSVYNSERLLRTELARVQTEVQKDSFEKAEFDDYEYIAEPTACDICAALDGEIFKVKDMESGTNASPMHPHCMCSHAAAMDREEWDADLKARGL